MYVNGMRFVAKYQPVWNKHTTEFIEYWEKLEAMMMSNNLLVLGRDFSSSVGTPVLGAEMEWPVGLEWAVLNQQVKT